MLFPKHENVSTACRFTSLRPYVPGTYVPAPLCLHPYVLRPYVVDREKDPYRLEASQHQSTW